MCLWAGSMNIGNLELRAYTGMYMYMCKTMNEWAIPVNENTPPWKSKLAISLKTTKLLAYYPSEPIKSLVVTPKD